MSEEEISMSLSSGIDQQSYKKEHAGVKVVFVIDHRTPNIIDQIIELEDFGICVS